MTVIDAARLVVAQRTYHLLRQRKDEPQQFDVKKYAHRGNKHGWFLLDLFTASALVAVYDALSETNRAKFVQFPIVKMASIAFKLIK